MAEAPDLWHASFRKEAMDMMSELWRTLDDDGRQALTDALTAGPPDTMFDRLDEEERQGSRDRRIYDRLVVLERVGEPPLTAALSQLMADIRARYPHWRAMEGERAHFSSWFESRWGPDTNYSLEDLVEMGEATLAERLRDDMDQREGLLDSWRQLATANPRLALNVLMIFADSADPGPADAWEAGLRGLREAEHGALITDDVMALLGKVPESLFDDRDFVRSAADLLEAKSRNREIKEKPASFWTLFDRALDAAGREPPIEPDFVADADYPARLDWVHEAINRSMGILATTFINAIYALRPGPAATLGTLTDRANRLMAPRKVEHRYARVIGASRISYLYAVDPTWSAKTLIPSFAWKDEEEAIAMWQGYAWQMRIDPQLWAVLKPHFLPLFEAGRLARFGSAGRNVAQALMLVGIAFGADELKRDDVRNALRIMPEEFRADAAAWIAGYMEAQDADNEADDDEPIDGTPDMRWERIWPWIKRVWPIEPSLQSAEVGEQFALAAIATDAAFPGAVEDILPYAVPAHHYRLITELKASPHPDEHAAAALTLVDAFIAPEQVILFEGDLADIVERIGNADRSLRDDNRHRRWSEFLGKIPR